MNLQDISKLGKTLEKFTVDNSPTILTAIGAAGTLTTAVLTAKATFKAAKKIQDKQFVEHLHQPAMQHKNTELTKKEKVKLVWTCYIPPTVVGVGTVASIIGANRISNRRAAAMAAAYSLSQHAFEEYKDKVIEKVGKTKERAVRDEVAQDAVNQNPPSKNEIFVANNGDVLCYDKYTGRYFMSTMDALRKAENDINFHVIHNTYANLNDFYRMVGLPIVPMGEEVGWVADMAFHMDVSTTIADNGKPCLVIDYQVCGVRKRPDTFNLSKINPEMVDFS